MKIFLHASEIRIFAANRVELIKNPPDECQWFYISSKQNPADHTSRKIDICNQNKFKKWFLGSKFPLKPKEK